MKPSTKIELQIDNSDQEALLSEFDLPAHHKPKRSRRPWSTIAILITTAVISFLLGSISHTEALWNWNQFCTAIVARPSPLLADIDIKYETIRFNGSFLRENIYRQSARPEVDTAWEALGANYRSVAIPESRAAQAGLRPDQVRINPKYGGGYPANVEGLHQLHCLNLVRQALYYNYEYYHALGQGAFKNDDRIVKLHVSHCLDIIRQQLQCTIDISVMGQVWTSPGSSHLSHSHFPSKFNSTSPGIEGQLQPFVDFNTLHRCRNFDTIRQWAQERQLPVDVPEDFLAPPREGQEIIQGTP